MHYISPDLEKIVHKTHYISNIIWGTVMCTVPFYGFMTYMVLDVRYLSLYLFSTAIYIMFTIFLFLAAASLFIKVKISNVEQWEEWFRAGRANYKNANYPQWEDHDQRLYFAKKRYFIAHIVTWVLLDIICISGMIVSKFNRDFTIMLLTCVVTFPLFLLVRPDIKNFVIELKKKIA